mmetsp:Transcript_35008/g.68750  ORF Transcript_35008/g.68750 Transcript_35008/m.68750 type:complete len:81 (+) Transcript_35008:542-784(+)
MYLVFQNWDCAKGTSPASPEACKSTWVLAVAGDEVANSDPPQNGESSVFVDKGEGVDVWKGEVVEDRRMFAWKCAFWCCC